MTKPALAPGLWIQPYRDAIQNHWEVPVQLDRFQQKRVSGVFWHGFPTEGSGWVQPLMEPVRSRGMLVGACEGLDTTMRTAQQKGASMRALANCGIDLLGADDESRMYDTAGSDEYVREMFAALGPVQCIVLDQPWPSDQGHEQYAFTEQGRWVDVRGPQFYTEVWRRYLHRKRYTIKFPEWEGRWVRLETQVFTPDAIKPRIVTVEGYQTWSEIQADCTAMFLSRKTVVAWCEPWPGDAFLRSWDARLFLIDRGILLPDLSNGGDAVLRFQQDYNRGAPEAKKLTEDNRGGDLTLKAMGL